MVVEDSVATEFMEHHPVIAGNPERIGHIAEIGQGKGLDTVTACRNAGITDVTYYRWRKEYGGLKIDQAKKAWDERDSYLDRIHNKLQKHLGNMSGVETHLAKALLGKGGKR